MNSKLSQKRFNYFKFFGYNWLSIVSDKLHIYEVIYPTWTRLLFFSCCKVFESNISNAIGSLSLGPRHGGRSVYLGMPLGAPQVPPALQPGNGNGQNLLIWSPDSEPEVPKKKRGKTKSSFCRLHSVTN